MGARLLCAVLTLCFLPAAGSAQTGLRSASLPEHNLTSSMHPEREDLFRARPDTYVQRYDRLLPRHRQIHPGGAFYVIIAPYETITYRNGLEARTSNVAPSNPAPSPPAPSPLARSPLAPPKTFYVIPGCYAGDKPPSADRLPPTCDITKLRIVPPVVSVIARGR